MRTASGISVAELLCSHIDLLRKQHRAGITPSYGQVDDLFDLSDRLRVESARGTQADAPAPTCAVCGSVAIVTAPGAVPPYCELHARGAADVVRYLSALLPSSPARAGWPVMSQEQGATV